MTSICSTCETSTDTLTCEECGKPFCMGCYRRYEWKDTSRLCWVCQSEADMEWLATDLDSSVRRTGPRKQPPICPACDGCGETFDGLCCPICGGAGIVAP